MKLNTTKITDNAAIHCPKLEYVRPLFEAMGLSESEIEKAELNWGYNMENTCFIFQVTDWTYNHKRWCEYGGIAIIPFEDLIIPEESNLIKALYAVRPSLKEWLHEGVEFNYSDKVYRIVENYLHVRTEGSGWINPLSVFEGMVRNPELIKPIPRWTPEEQEDAKKDRFRFGYVAKTKNCCVILHEKQPKYNKAVDYWIAGSEIFTKVSATDYPSLQPGELASLEEIAGGTE